MLVFAAVGVILWIGGRDVIAGRLSGGDLSAFVFYAVVVAGSEGAISEVVGELQRAAGAAERLSDLLALETDIPAPVMPRALPREVEGRVAVEAVIFRCPYSAARASDQHFSMWVAARRT